MSKRFSAVSGPMKTVAIHGSISGGLRFKARRRWNLPRTFSMQKEIDPVVIMTHGGIEAHS